MLGWARAQMEASSRCFLRRRRHLLLVSLDVLFRAGCFTVGGALQRRALHFAFELGELHFLLCQTDVRVRIVSESLEFYFAKLNCLDAF